jgi:RNA polymerase sigma factor for flagellar operon FliA
MLLTFVEEPQNARAGVHTQQERDKLILQWMPLVYSIARRMAWIVAGEMTFEDLVSVGTVGLISAIDNFDPSYDVKLNTYATYRIRGAILDSIRSSDWMPRRQRARVKLMQNAMAKAQNKHQRIDVSDHEIANELNVSVEEYRESVASLPVTRIVSIEETEQDGDNRGGTCSTSHEELPSTILEREELHSFLDEAIRRLAPEEQTVLSLHYDEELSPQEIARIMKIPAKRVYQLKAQAILRLRATLNRRVLRRRPQ